MRPQVVKRDSIRSSGIVAEVDRMANTWMYNGFEIRRAGKEHLSRGLLQNTITVATTNREVKLPTDNLFSC
jgi:hypothetical protein